MPFRCVSAISTLAVWCCEMQAQHGTKAAQLVQAVRAAACLPLLALPPALRRPQHLMLLSHIAGCLQVFPLLVHPIQALHGPTHKPVVLLSSSNAVLLQTALLCMSCLLASAVHRPTEQCEACTDVTHSYCSWSYHNLY